MHLFALTFSRHSALRLEEVGALLAAIAGVLLALAAATRSGGRSAQLLGGLALAAGGVLVIIALHYGK